MVFDTHKNKIYYCNPIFALSKKLLGYSTKVVLKYSQIIPTNLSTSRVSHIQWRSQGLPRWAACPPGGPKWGEKWRKFLGNSGVRGWLRPWVTSNTFQHLKSTLLSLWLSQWKYQKSEQHGNLFISIKN